MKVEPINDLSLTDGNKLKILRNESFIEPIILNPFVHKVEFKLLDKVKVI